MEILVALAIGTAIVLAALSSLIEPPGRDQGVYLYAGRQILRGEILHRDLFDQRPPGMSLVYALGMALFGESMFGVHLIDLAWCLLMAGAVYLVGRQAFGRSAGALAALLFGVSYQLFFNWWDSAQCDGLMTLPLVIAIYFTLLAEERGKGALYLAAGAFCGVAFWFKPNGAWIALALGFIALTGRPRKAAIVRAAALVGGFLGVGTGVVIGYWLFDGLIDMLDAVFAFNLVVYVWPAFNVDLLRSWAHWTGRFLLKAHLLVALAGVASVWALTRRRNRQTAILLA